MLNLTKRIQLMKKYLIERGEDILAKLLWKWMKLNTVDCVQILKNGNYDNIVQWKSIMM